VAFSDQIYDEEFLVFEHCKIVSSESNILDTLFGCDEVSSKEIFKALRPIDLRLAQTISPLLDIHTNEVILDLFLLF